MQQLFLAVAAFAIGSLPLGKASERACVEFLRGAGDSMSDAELSLLCRSQFDSAVCEPLARHLGDRPWALNQITDVCDEVVQLAPESEALERSLHLKLRSNKIIRRCQKVAGALDNPSVPWEFFHPYCMSKLGVENCVVLSSLLAAAGGADGGRPIGGVAISAVCLDLAGSVPLESADSTPLSTDSATTTGSARLLRLFESDAHDLDEVGNAQGHNAGTILALSALFTGLLVTVVASITLARQGRAAVVLEFDNIAYARQGLSDEVTA